jgi:hypothetical protein
LQGDTIVPVSITARPTREGLRLGPLSVSFQRFEAPAGGSIQQAPSSLGALPVGENDRGEWLLPVADGEAFWIGVNAEPAAELALRVDTQRDGALDALSGKEWDVAAPQVMRVTAFVVIAGIHRGDGLLWAFARRPKSDAALASRAVSFVVRNDHHQGLIEVRLIDYPGFAAQTGRPPPAPLDPDAGYKGVLLP